MSRQLNEPAFRIFNPDYRIVEKLKPIFGVGMFLGWLFIFMAISLALGPMVMKELEAGSLLEPVVLSQVPLLLYSLIFILAMRLTLKDLKIEPLNSTEILMAILVAMVALFIAIAVLIPVYLIHQAISPGFLDQSIKEAKLLQDAMIPNTGPELILTLILMAVVPAIIEELFFRGLIFDSFLRMGPWWALAVSSVTFGIMHQLPLRIPSMIAVGFILAIFKYKTRKLTASMVVHVVYNSFIVGITFAAGRFMNFDMLSLIFHR